jgi:hypothetical protein
LKTDPTNTEGLFGIGLFSEGEKLTDTAISYYRRVLQYNKTKEEAYLRLG